MGVNPEESPPSDAELWARARDADPASFGQLFERHAEHIFRYCRQQLETREEAEDLTSVVFLEAWRRRNDVVFADGSVLPWLIAVANNSIRNRRRAVWRHRRLLAKLPPPDVEEDHSDRVAGQVDVERDGHHVVAAFRQLRPIEQDVLALCVWHDFSHEAAAVALGVPTGTVKSRLSRARQRLRELAEREIATRAVANTREPSTRPNA